MADVAFLIDSSGSIRRERFPIILEFVKGVVENFDVNPQRTRVGTIYWSQDAKVQFRLGEYAITASFFPFLRGCSPDCSRAALHTGVPTSTVCGLVVCGLWFVVLCLGCASGLICGATLIDLRPM